MAPRPCPPQAPRTKPEPSTPSYYLGRLRFLRKPPEYIELPSTGNRTVEVPLGVGLTDDYGAHIDTFESIELKLEIIATEGVEFAETRSAILPLVFSPLSGSFVTLKPVLNIRKATSFQFRLSVVDTTTEPADAFMRIIRTQSQRPLVTWDDRKYVFIPSTSEKIELRTSRNFRSARVSKEKSQTEYRELYPNDADQPITILERTGMNNSTGQRLWDCAIVLLFYLRQCLSSKPPRSTMYVELGSGCGLGAMCVAQRSESNGVICTDVIETVESTLEENLKLNNALKSGRLSTSVLEWGSPVDDGFTQHLKRRLKREKPQHMCVLGTDILYNTGTHPLLLETLVDLFKEYSTLAPRALIVFKSRSDHDADFFSLATEAGLEVDIVWTWGNIFVYELRLK